MGHQIIPLLQISDYDFSTLPGGTVVSNLPLVQNVDLTQWGTATLIVRIHDATLKSGSFFRIDARAVAPTSEDPSAFFRDGIVATIQTDSTTVVAPSVLETRLADNAGVAISLFLTVNQKSKDTHQFTISIDLLVQEPAVGWTPSELGSKLTLWLDQRDQVEVSQVYSDWGNQAFDIVNDFTQGTAANRPAAGLSINGFSAPNFDGTNDSMSSGAIGNLITASGYHVFAVFRARSIAGTNATAYLNDGVIADTGLGWWGLYLKKNGAVYEVHGFHWGSGLHEATASGLILNEDSLVEWSFDGSNIRCRLGIQTSAVATGVSNVGDVTNPASIGVGATGSLYMDGMIACIVVCKNYLSDSEIRNMRAYLSSRYGVPA